MKPTLLHRILFETHGGYYGACRVLINRLKKKRKEGTITVDELQLLIGTQEYLYN